MSGPANANASSFSVGNGVGYSLANGSGPSGHAIATSTATGDLQHTVTAQGNAQVGGTANSHTQATFGGSVNGLPNLTSSSYAYESFSFVNGAPNSSSVNTLLSSHSNVNAAVGASNLDVIGVGAMGNDFGSNVTGVHTYTSSGEYTFTLGNATEVVVGLLDFTGRDAGAATDLMFTVSNFGSTILSQGFTSLGAADAYFTDHALSLGGLAGNVDLSMTFSMTTGSDQGAGFSYLVAAAPVPEPSQWLLLLAGLGILGSVARSSSKQASGSYRGA
jgi:hypothetical protein